MTFSERIGEKICVHLVTPIGLDEYCTDVLGSFVAKLVEVEPGGVWILCEELAKPFEETLWKALLRDAGPEYVDKGEIVFFLPFARILFVICVRARLDEES